ncbi:hypothetical protein JT31_21715 [Cedecea neteri]|uniref:Uncharacterized protein n=1 Tax=Cedecea neteri TaxID=158822 RepID=A0A089Q750_9ENTR|nr:hypothetical protein [Cedecea neteri]AIR07136.1 hypothetical protein JT31_21715 [Cedecea neteri]
MFNTSIFTLNKISHDSVEIIAEENVFAYAVINPNNSVTVKFPGSDSNSRGCITHRTFDSNADALDEIARVWDLIIAAERNAFHALCARKAMLPVISMTGTAQ